MYVRLTAIGLFMVLAHIAQAVVPLGEDDPSKPKGVAIPYRRTKNPDDEPEVLVISPKKEENRKKGGLFVRGKSQTTDSDTKAAALRELGEEAGCAGKVKEGPFVSYDNKQNVLHGYVVKVKGESEKAEDRVKFWVKKGEVEGHLKQADMIDIWRKAEGHIQPKKRKTPVGQDVSTEGKALYENVSKKGKASI